MSSPGPPPQALPASQPLLGLRTLHLPAATPQSPMGTVPTWQEETLQTSRAVSPALSQSQQDLCRICLWELLCWSSPTLSTHCHPHLPSRTQNRCFPREKPQAFLPRTIGTCPGDPGSHHCCLLAPLLSPREGRPSVPQGATQLMGRLAGNGGLRSGPCLL